MINDILFPESMEKTEGLDAQEVLKIHDDYIRYIVERIRFAFNGYSNKRKFIEAIEDVVEDGPLAKDLQNEKSAREQAIDQLNEKLKDAAGLYSTVDPATNIIYMHDKPEDPGVLPPYTNSKYVVMVSTEGISVSDEGGAEGTYKFAIKLNGEAILKKIYAEGIDAQYIKANTLSADKIEATEGTYDETNSWNSLKLSYIASYFAGYIDKEAAIRAGGDVNGDGQVDFLDLALVVDAMLDRAPWNENGGTYKAQIKCDNPFNAISVSNDDKTAFSAGIHGAYMSNGYVGNQLKVFAESHGQDGATSDGVILDPTKLSLKNPFGSDDRIPESLQYSGYQGGVDLDHKGIRFNNSLNYTYGTNGYRYGNSNVTYNKVAYDNTSGTVGYVALLQFWITGAYANGPMQMEICSRAYFTTAYLTLNNSGSVAGTTISSFRYRGIGSPTLVATIEDDPQIIFHSDGTQTTVPRRKVIVYAKKSEAYDEPCIVSFKTSDYQGARIQDIQTGGHWFSAYAPTDGVTATAL